MAQCTLSDKIEGGFGRIGTMKADDVDTLFSEYDRAVFAQPACAEPDRYILIAEQFQRHNKFDLTNLALAKALLAGPPDVMPYARIAAVYSKMGFSEAPGILKYVSYVQKNRATTVASPKRNPVEYWQGVACEDDLERCRGELQSAQAAFTQNLKHQLLLSLYASYYHLAASPADISTWLVDPMTLGAWQRDPQLVVDVLDYFVQKREVALENGDVGEMGNTLLVIRDLLKLTARFRWTEPVHHPDLKAFFRPYYDNEGYLMTAVRQGIAYYLLFLLQLSGGQVPDDPLMAALKTMSSNKDWANRVESMAKSRKKSPGAAPGRKKQ